MKLVREVPESEWGVHCGNYGLGINSCILLSFQHLSKSMHMFQSIVCENGDCVI